MLVLVVEDEALIAMTLENCLLDAGYQVLGPAARGSQALRLAENVRPDLALVDINLRDGPMGVTVARELFRRWKTPSLFLSAQGGEARANQDAALGLILKPYRLEGLISCVEIALRLLRGETPERSEIPYELELFQRLDRAG